MKKTLLVILCVQLLAISLQRHLVLSKGLTLQQFQGVKVVEADSGNMVQVKDVLKAGKGAYGAANMNRDPRASKSNAPSSRLPRGFCIGIGIAIGISVSFFMPRLFGF